MARQALGPRERMVISTALLVRERGARATSLDDVLQHSGAPRGSVYHHFPGGREQLLREATDCAGSYVAARLERAVGGDPLALVDAIVAEYTGVLTASDYRAGCPVVAVVIEGGSDTPDLTENARRAFARWQELIARAGETAGIPRERAAELATLTIASVEGAIILSRAQRDLSPLNTVAAELRRRFAEELPAV